MSAADIVGPVLFASFGLWWVIFPQSVIRFYGRLHGSRVQLPSAFVIRCIGVGWVILIGSVMLLTRKPHMWATTAWLLCRLTRRCSQRLRRRCFFGCPA